MSFTKVESRGLIAGHVGIRTAGGFVGTGFTILNFIGAGNTFAVHNDQVDISIAGRGGAGEILKETFNVTTNQTVFNITEGQFDEGFLEVYLNGVKLNQSDFTENPPTQFTLDVAAAPGDVVEIIGFKDRGTNTSVQADVSNLNSTGIVTASQYFGDGSKLFGVVGLGTELSANTPVLGDIFYTNNVLSVGSTVTVELPTTADTNIGYTHYADLAVDQGADFIVADGDEFIADVLGIGTDVGPLPSNGGRVRADEFTNRAGNGAPSFPYGISLGGSSGINDEENNDGFITYQHDMNISEDKTLTGSTSTTIGTKRRSIIVAATKSLILGPDCELVINTPGI